MRLPYTLVRRTIDKAKRKTVYYYRLATDPTRSLRSTGQTQKAAARAWVETNILGRRETPTLAEFTRDFFRWDVCPWIARQHAQGKAFARPMAVSRRGHLDRYILPVFGRLSLRDLKAAAVSDFLIGLRLRNATRNQVMSTFRIVMDEAVFREFVEYNCVRNLKRFAEDWIRKDVFTREELQRLFPVDPVLVWGSLYWAAFFLTMLTTGIRRGEARALTWSNMDQDVSALAITQAVKADNSIGVPKNTRARAVYLPARTLAVLRAWREATLWPGPDDLIFHGKDGARIVSDTAITRAWDLGLAAAGVVRGGRVLVIHSLRHTYNTEMRKLIDETALRYMIGHHSEAMTARYDQAGPLERLRAVLPDREKIDRAWS